MTDRKIEISISPALQDAMPDLARIWKASDDNGFFAALPDVPSNGTLERIATEQYDAMTVRPKLPRDEVIAMLASKLLEEAKDTIAEKVATAVLAPPQKTMKDLIADVRAADKAYADLSLVAFKDYDPNDDTLWNAKQDARRALRDTVFETTGVSIDDLHLMTRT